MLRGIWAGVAVIGITALTVAPLRAQQAAALEEITVTAQRRSENLMTVPVAVSVISGESLAASGIGSTGDLKLVTPGLVYDELDGFPLYYIRGVGTDFTQPGVNAAVAIYNDGIYQNFSQSSSQSLLDVERVEVLKGPQGTLYGRNSTAGAINIITRRPAREGVVADFVAGVGNLQSQNFKAYVAGPIGGSVSGSVAAVYEGRDSHIRNGFTGKRLADRSSYGARGKLLGELEGGGEWELAGWWFKATDDGNGAFHQLQKTSTGAVFGPLIGGGRLSNSPDLVYNDFPVFWEMRQQGAHLRIRVPFDGVDLVSLTGYQDWLDPSGVDFDATDAPIAFFFSDSTTRTVSQELQLVSTEPGAFDWVAGVYYFRNDGAFAPLQVPAGNAPPLTIRGPLTVIRTSSEAEATAAFAQASVKFGADNAWRVSIGGRYSREKATLKPATISVGSTVVAAIPGTDTTWTDVSPRFTLDYSTDNSLTYLTVSRGFKSGAYNLASPGDLKPVSPEKLTAVELGYKLTFAEGRARVEVAAFDYDYKNLQVQFITNQTAPITLGNAKEASSRGVEISLTSRPTQQFELTAGLAWLQRARYDSYGERAPGGIINGGVAYTDNGAGNTASIGNFTGNRLAHAPKWSGNLTATYTARLGSGSLRLSGNLYHSDEYFFSAENSRRAVQPSYTTLNTRATWQNESERWSVSLWGNNVTDKTYYSQILVNALGTLAQYAGRRTYGVEVGYSIR